MSRRDARGSRVTLTTRARESDEDLQRIYPALSRELRGIFSSRGIAADEANDLAQETIVRTLVHLKRHRRVGDSVRPLVHTIARNLLITRVRRRQLEFVPLTTDEDVADESRQPLDEIIHLERRQTVQQALRSLSSRHRQVVTMWMDGLTPAHIARELGIKRNAADALLHRARRRLASKLEPGSAAFGVIGLMWARLRSGLRRVSDVLSASDPTGSLASSASGIAAVAAVAALAVSSPAVGNQNGAASASDQQRAPAAAAIPEQSTDTGVSETAAAPPVFTVESPGESSRRIAADVRDHRAELSTGGGSRAEGEDSGIGIAHERDDGGTSNVGSLLYRVTDTLCDQAGQLCVGDDK